MTVDSFRCAIVLAHDCLMIPVLDYYCLVVLLFAVVAGRAEDMVQWADGGGENRCRRIRCRIPCETCSVGNSCIQGTGSSVHLSQITVRSLFFYSGLFTAVRSGLVVTLHNCSVRGTRFTSHRGQCVYHVSHCDIQPWAETLLQCLGHVIVPPFVER